MKSTETANSFFHILNTPFAAVAVVWSVYRGQPAISRVILSTPELAAGQIATTLFPDSTSSSCGEINEVGRQIESFLHGDDICFSLDMVRLDLCLDFQQRVLRAEHGIPRGLVSSYKRIARHVGMPSGARAVGTALSKNPFPVIIPCHRAIRSDGTLGGYQGGLEMKQALLEMEGIRFNASGRVVSEEIFY